MPNPFIIRYKKLCTLLLFVLGAAAAQAQEAITATGGNASGSGGVASYSVGQVVYQEHTGANGAVAEGVQQAYEIFVVTALAEAEGILLAASAFPNPATEYLTLQIDKPDLSHVSFRLYDMQGKLLQTAKVTGTQTNIIMSNLATSTYFVKVFQNNRELKTFRIMKTSMR